MESIVKYNMQTYSSSEILELVKSNQGKTIEVQLLLIGGYATHFIYCNKNRIFNEGIDGVNFPISEKHFLELYPTAFWKLNQIV